MNNLKRVLSLGLAGTMLAGMMMVGAGAANKEFTDAEDITHVEAVNSMAALGVIAGKDTGAFDPEGIVTRAEMAKIICVMLSGGVDPTLGVKATPTYSDIKGHWAESYIEYCSSIGIIAGQGDGTFGPDATVTSSAAAKMFMVALGYDSDVFGFTGVDWEINTNREASDAKLYEDLKGIAVSEGMTRDSAAQMAYNALDAKVMEKTYDKVQSNGEISYNYKLSDTESFLNKYFDAHTFIGTYTGNYDSGASSNKGEVAVYGKLDNATAESPKVSATFPSDMDISNIGEEVKIIFKDGKGGSANKPDKKDTIYGVFNTGATTVYEVTKADIQDSESSTKIKFGGTKYDIDTANGVEVVTNYITESPTTYTNAATLQGVIKAQSVDTIKFVTNEDGKINAAYITVLYYGRVTGATSSKVTISGLGAIEVEDNDIYEGIAKDDVVSYTKFYSTVKDDATYAVTKAESVEGELTGFKKPSSGSDNGKYVNVVLDGTTYKMESKPTSIASLSDDALTSLTDGNIGDTVRLYLVGGMVVGIQAIDQNGGKYALITEISSDGTIGSNMEPLKVTVILPDGSKQTLNIHKDSTYDGSNKIKGLGDTHSLQVGKFETSNGTLVEYSSINNGEIKIKSVAGKGDYGKITSRAPAAITGTGAAGNARVWDKTAKTLTKSTTATSVASVDAVAYVRSAANSEYYAYNLRGLGNIDNTSAGVKVSYYEKDGQLVAAYMELASRPGTNSADTLYGIVTGYNGTRTFDNDTYYQYTVAAGREEDVVVNVDNDTTLVAGNLVMFDEASDAKYHGYVSASDTGDITVLVTADDTAATDTVIGAVKDYSESNRLLTYYTGTTRATVTSDFTGSMSSVTVDKDVKIVYVNAKDNEAGEEIGVGAFDASTGYANVVFHKNTDHIVDAIIVETSGKANLASTASNKKVATTAFGSTTPATVTATATVVASSTGGSENGAYSLSLEAGSAVTSKAVATGASFTVYVNCTGINAANSKETVTVTFDGVDKTLDFVSGTTSQQSVTFDSASTNSVTITVTDRTPVAP